MTFRGKTVWITGASSGIGRALAEEFFRQGANLLVTARREVRLQELARQLDPSGGKVRVLRADVLSRSDMDRAVDTARDAFGSLDIVVANAGFGVAGRFEDLSTEDYKRQFDTNVWGLLDTVYAALPEIRKNSGSIVLIGSVAGHIAVPGQSAYSMSKFAVRAFASALYHELSPEGVAVTLVSPGFVESEIRKVDNSGKLVEDARDPVPPRIMISASQAARQTVRGVAKRKREVILTGFGKSMVFLYRHFTGPMHWLMSRARFKGRPEPRGNPPV